MSKDERVGYPIGAHQAAEVGGFDSLAELALNMCWSWNHATDDVWRRLEPELWEITHSPWVVLQTARQARGLSPE
jgi:starch phosphorylase